MLSMVFIFFLIFYGTEGQSIDDTDISVSTDKSVNCTLRVNEQKTCESCLTKGDECFWCGGNVQKCMNYEWYFPDCDLDNVKHKKCWVNWTALIVVVSVICGIIIVILISVVCYVCCRCRNCSHQRRKKKFEKREAKEQKKRDDLSMKHMERSAKRDEEMQYYRDKYGIPKSDAGSLPSKKSF